MKLENEERGQNFQKFYCNICQEA